MIQVEVRGLALLHRRLAPVLGGPLRKLAQRIYRPLARRLPVTLVISGEPQRFQFGTQPPYADGRLVGEHRIFTEAIHSADLVVDVGAHHGTFTILAGGRVGAGGQVVAFEPAPASLERLRRNVRLNRYADRVTIVAAVAGDRNTPTSFYVRGEETTNRPFAPGPDESGYTGVPAPMVRLDDYLAERTPAVLKIDVEGSEFAVLRGAERLLGSGARFFCELHPEEWWRAGHSGDDLFDWLRACGRSAVWLESREPVSAFRYGNVELVRT